MELDCVACGACCHGLVVRVLPDAEARLTGAELAELTELDDHGSRTMRRRPDGSCFALVKEPGRFLCKIYDRRPRACAAFERGSKRCLDWRVETGRTR